MNKAQDGLYEIELRRVASQLDLGRTGNIEDKIIGHCLERLRSWVAVHGEPQTLSDLRDRIRHVPRYSVSRRCAIRMT